MTDTEIRTLEKKLDDPSHPGYERLRRDLGIAQKDSFEADERRMVLSRPDRFECE